MDFSKNSKPRDHIYLDISAGKTEVSERNPRFAPSKMLAPAVWSHRPDETKQKPL